MYEIRVPEAGFSLPEAVIGHWLKEPGEAVTKGETVVTLETDKLSVDVPAEGNGVLSEIRNGEGETVAVGAVIGVIADDAPKEAPESRTPSKPTAVRRVSPRAKALAREHGISIHELPPGSGPGDRVVMNDVEAFLRRGGDRDGKDANSRLGTKQQPAATTDVFPEARVTDDYIRFSGWQQMAARRMTESFQTIPHYALEVEVDVTELASFLRILKEEEPGIHFTYLVFVAKAVSLAVKRLPEANAHCDGEGYSIKRAINVGIAVDVAGKLVVPVLRDVGNKTIVELAVELSDLVARAREDRLEAADLSGSTITITNIGAFGAHAGFALINPPEVSIVCIGAARDRPRFEGEDVIRRRVMTVGASFDHRVVQGAQGGGFLQALRSAVEDPRRMAIRLR